MHSTQSTETALPGRRPPIIVEGMPACARRRRAAMGLPPRLVLAGLVLAAAAGVGHGYLPIQIKRATGLTPQVGGPAGAAASAAAASGSFLRPSGHLPTLGRKSQSKSKTALHMARDLIDVKGLPKANIMRTNSSAAYTLEPGLLDGEGRGTFDLSRSVQRAYEDMVDMATSVDLKELRKALPLPAEGVVSSAALIAGCMIGAGVLALPSVTVHAGVMPSTLAIGTVWAYCAISGLLIGEVCINSRGAHAHASYLKIAGATVGKGIASLAFALFSVFQYFLLAAYISQGGTLLDGFVHMVPGLAGLDLGPVFGPAAFTSAMAALFLFCNQRALESTNNAVVMGVVVSFAALLAAGMGSVDPSLYTHMDFHALQNVVPVAMCALVFQNVVPVVAANLGFDRSKVISAILLGSGVPAFMYLTWNAMILGNVAEGSLGPHGLDLYNLLGGGGSAVGLTLRAFSLGAIATSFIGCFLSIVEEFNEFLRSLGAGDSTTAEGTTTSTTNTHASMTMTTTAAPAPAPLAMPITAPEDVVVALEEMAAPVVEVVEEMERELAEAVAASPAVTEAQVPPHEGGSMSQNIPMLLVVLLPPVLCATLYPDGFLGAIETSGGFGDPFLFGLLPVIMAWRQRYGGPEPGKTPDGQELVEPLVPGGKAGLVGLAAFAAAMLLNKAFDVAPHVAHATHQAVDLAMRALNEVAA